MFDQGQAFATQLDRAAGQPRDVVRLAPAIPPGEFGLVVVEVDEHHDRLVEHATVQALTSEAASGVHARRRRLRDEVIDRRHLPENARRRDHAHRRGIAIDVEQHLAIREQALDIAVAHGQHALLLEEAHGIAKAATLRVLRGVDTEPVVAARTLLDPGHQFGGEHLVSGLLDRRQHEAHVDVCPTRQLTTGVEPGAAVS